MSAEDEMRGPVSIRSSLAGVRRRQTGRAGRAGTRGHRRSRHRCRRARRRHAVPAQRPNRNSGAPHAIARRQLEAKAVAFARDVVASAWSAAPAEMARAVTGSRHRGE